MKKFQNNSEDDDYLPKKNRSRKKSKKLDRALKTRDIDFLSNYEED